MITIEKLNIYKKYAGDGDTLIRCGTPTEKNLLSYQDLKDIDQLMQAIILVDNGLASDAFKEAANRQLMEACDSQKTMEQLSALAKHLNKKIAQCGSD